MPEYEAITRFRIAATIKDLDGDLADPDALEFSIQEPNGTVTSYTWPSDPEVERVDAGDFYIEWDATQAGYHKYRWQATGAVLVAFGGAFNVKAASF